MQPIHKFYRYTLGYTKAVSATVLGMINAIGHDKFLIFNGSTF